MGEGGVTKRIWLHMLREGGRWDADEVADLVKGKRPAVVKGLNAMATCGSVKKFSKVAGKRVQFGVTPDCKIANGVTIAEILAANLGALAEPKA